MRIKLRAVSIIEFKKPQRPNFDKDPIGQMYDIIRDIKDSKIRTSKRKKSAY